eukprot:Lithocolla_globosa_v1_NODE_6462_length_1084_cov_3.353741.p1 type:complete len:231 gc:universal NODE_6462_length_1084_cov_3.353741:772-80(-)
MSNILWEDLPREAWLVVLSFLPAKDLCSVASLGKRFRQLSDNDSLWKRQCASKWNDKQHMPQPMKDDELFWRSPYLQKLTTKQCKQILSRRGYDFQHIVEKSELEQLVNSTCPMQNVCSTFKSVWKASYAYALVDSRRQMITLEEVPYFRWNLFYNGVPSKNGLRHFQKGGDFFSPYFGKTYWDLVDQYFVLAGGNMLVERNPVNWGWFIGRGTATEYHSVDVEKLQPKR